MSDRLDPRLESGFDALRAESDAEPRLEAMARARAAMHQARATQPQPRGAALFTERLRQVMSPRRLMAGGTGLVAGMAAVAALGWNAPAGSPLHAVRVAHESLSLALPGSDRVGLDLGFAESRMREAQRQSGSWSSSLDEAAGFLDDARSHLGEGSPQWSRWENDESQLATLRLHDQGDDRGGLFGGSDDGGSGAATSTQSSSSRDESGDDRGDTSSSSSSTREESQSSTSTSEHEGGSSSSTTSQSTSSTSEGGGGTDGGSGGGGGESSSSTSTSSSSGDH